MSLNKQKSLAAAPLEMQKELNAQTKKHAENLGQLKESEKETKKKKKNQYVKKNERRKKS